MNSNAEIKDLVKSIRRCRGRNPNLVFDRDYRFPSPNYTSGRVVSLPGCDEVTGEIFFSKKKSKLKKFLLSLFSIFNLFTINKLK